MLFFRCFSFYSSQFSQLPTPSRSKSSCGFTFQLYRSNDDKYLTKTSTKGPGGYREEHTRMLNPKYVNTCLSFPSSEGTWRRELLGEVTHAASFQICSRVNPNRKPEQGKAIKHKEKGTDLLWRSLQTTLTPVSTLLLSQPFWVSIWQECIYS